MHHRADVESHPIDIQTDFLNGFIETQDCSVQTRQRAVVGLNPLGNPAVRLERGVGFGQGQSEGVRRFGDFRNNLGSDFINRRTDVWGQGFDRFCDALNAGRLARQTITDIQQISHTNGRDVQGSHAREAGLHFNLGTVPQRH